MRGRTAERRSQPTLAQYTPYSGPPQGRDPVVPGSGYTPPVGPSPGPVQPQPPQPRRPGDALRRRARLNSVDWWRWQALKGAIYGGLLLAPGLLVVGISQTRGDYACLLGPGLIAMLGGLIVLGVYLLAPYTQKWIVTVPQNQYWAVEDLSGAITLGYLAPGDMEIQRKFNTRLVPYVGFTTLQVTTVVPNVFDTQDLPVDIEVVALILFDPTQADPDEYHTLRTMTSPRQFEFEIRRQIDSVVRAYMGRLDPVRNRSVQDTMHGLEAAIAEHLSHLAALGLQPASGRPVSAYIRTPRAVPNHIRHLWDRGASNSQESELIRDIKEMMAAFNLSFDEAVRHYYLLKHGVQPPPGATGSPGATGTPGEPTIMHPGTGSTPGPAAPAGNDATVSHAGAMADTVPGSTAGSSLGEPSGDHGGRTIRDLDDVPDPFDLRRDRRDERRDERRNDQRGG